MDYLYFLENTKWFGQTASVLAIIGIPYAFIKLVVYKAKHKIYFEPKETYHEVKLLDYPKQPQSFWLHLMVKNNGYEMSKNAEAYISEIWVKRDNKYEKLRGFNSPVKLKWAHEADIYPIDIFPKQKRRLDVCYICEGVKILHLMANGFVSGSVKNMLDPADYLLVVQVASENSLMPAKFIFRVLWNGNWKTLLGSNYVKSFRICKKPVKSFAIY